MVKKRYILLENLCYSKMIPIDMDIVLVSVNFFIQRFTFCNVNGKIYFCSDVLNGCIFSSEELKKHFQGNELGLSDNYFLESGIIWNKTGKKYFLLFIYIRYNFIMIVFSFTRFNPHLCNYLITHQLYHLVQLTAMDFRLRVQNQSFKDCHIYQFTLHSITFYTNINGSVPPLQHGY